MDRGTLTAQKDAIGGTPVKEEDWTLGALGNWLGYLTKASGTTDLDQSRTHNTVNEITDITNTVGSAWAAVSHDAAGNMTSGPKGDDPTVRIHFIYDAWNRLVEAKNDSGGSPGATIATYRYDGRNYRIKKSLAGSDTFDYYYNDKWQVLEVRKNGTTYEQYLPDERYVDAVVLRWRDSDGNGTLDETLHATQDANFNLTALVSTSGTVVERYAFTAYGARSIYDSNWGSRTSSLYVWQVGHQGLLRDDETGLVQNRERFLHPMLGRFLVRDPVGYEDGLNLYEMVGSNPVVHTDPSGTNYAELVPEGHNLHEAPPPFLLTLRIMEKLRPLCKSCVQPTPVDFDGKDIWGSNKKQCCPSYEHCLLEALGIATAIVAEITANWHYQGFGWDGNIWKAQGFDYRDCSDWAEAIRKAAYAADAQYKNSGESCFEPVTVSEPRYLGLAGHAWFTIKCWNGKGTRVKVDPWPEGDVVIE